MQVSYATMAAVQAQTAFCSRGVAVAITRRLIPHQSEFW